jgi:hypothetical protein
MSTLHNDPEVDFNDIDEDTHHFSQPHMLKKADSIMSVLPPSSARTQTAATDFQTFL